VIFRYGLWLEGLLELLEEGVIFLIHVIRAADTIFHGRRESDKGVGFLESFGIQRVVLLSVDHPRGIGGRDIAFDLSTSGDSSLSSRDGSL
jgi:hypothetical protein